MEANPKSALGGLWTPAVQATNAPSRQSEENSLYMGVRLKGSAWVHRLRPEHSVTHEWSYQRRGKSLWNKTGPGLKSWICQPQIL